MARARRLAIAKASSASLGRFLLGQSDVIFMLCGGPAVWYVSHRRQRAQISQQVTLYAEQHTMNRLEF